MNDPAISMRSIRVVFTDPAHNYSTNINGTRASIVKYFRGKECNVGTYPAEIMRKPVRIDFLPDGAGTTVSVKLNAVHVITRARAVEIQERCRYLSIGTPWVEKLSQVMTATEYQAVHDILWQDSTPGTASFHSVFCDIMNGSLDVAEFNKIID